VLLYKIEVSFQNVTYIFTGYKMRFQYEKSYEK